MMHTCHAEPNYYLETSDEQVLGIPYRDVEYTMYIVLPKNRYGLSALLLDGNHLMRIIDKASMRPVLVRSVTVHALPHYQLPCCQVSLPRFRVEHKMPLATTLCALGLGDMFNGVKADFGNFDKILSLASPRLHVGQMIHNTVCEVGHAYEHVPNGYMSVL